MKINNQQPEFISISKTPTIHIRMILPNKEENIPATCSWGEEASEIEDLPCKLENSPYRPIFRKFCKPEQLDASSNSDNDANRREEQPSMEHQDALVWKFNHRAENSRLNIQKIEQLDSHESNSALPAPEEKENCEERAAAKQIDPDLFLKEQQKIDQMLQKLDSLEHKFECPSMEPLNEHEQHTEKPNEADDDVLMNMQSKNQQIKDKIEELKLEKANEKQAQMKLYEDIASNIEEEKISQQSLLLQQEEQFEENEQILNEILEIQKSFLTKEHADEGNIGDSEAVHQTDKLAHETKHDVGKKEIASKAESSRPLLEEKEEEQEPSRPKSKAKNLSARPITQHLENTKSTMREVERSMVLEEYTPYKERKIIDPYAEKKQRQKQPYEEEVEYPERKIDYISQALNNYEIELQQRQNKKDMTQFDEETEELKQKALIYKNTKQNLQ